MSNDNITTITDQQTITSLEIAEVIGRQHGHILRDIRVMEPAWEKEAHSKFGLSSYKDKSGKMCPLFILTKTECLFVATKFNDVARAKLVLRWEQLEKERPTQINLHSEETNIHSAQFNENNSSSGDNLPVDPRNMSRLQILQLALQAEEENERLRAEKQELEADNYGLMIDIGQKDQEIAKLQERTAYLNVIMADNGTVTASQIAQDYGMGAVSFNNLLKGLRIQRKIGEQWILYSDIINHGYVANRMIPIHHSGSPDTYKPLTVWTQLGRKFLYERLKKHGVLPVIERSVPAAVGTRQGQEGAAV